jgi:hypothetical protein
MSRIDMIAPSTTTPAIFRTAPSIFSGYVGGADCVGIDDTEWTSSGKGTGWWRRCRPPGTSDDGVLTAILVGAADERPMDLRAIGSHRAAGLLTAARGE